MRDLIRVTTVPWIADVYRLLLKPRAELAVWRDYLRFFRQTEFLRRETVVGEERRLLVLSLSNWVYQVKLEGIMSAGLRLHGWRPIVLTTSRRNTLARRYFESLGISDFVFLDEIQLNPGEKAHCREMAQQLLAGELSGSAVKGWNFDGCWIGPQVLSSVTRMTYSGVPDLADRSVRAGLERLLPSTLEGVVRAGKVVETVKPDLGLVIEANYATFGPLVDKTIATGAAVVQIIQPWRDDALTFWRLTRYTRRMHPASVTAVSLERLAADPWTDKEDAQLSEIFSERYGGHWKLQARNQVGTTTMERAEIISRLRLDRSKKNAVVFSHVLWDANLFYGEDLFEDYSDWFVQTLRAACANPRLNWLIKLHPANVWKRKRDGATGELTEHRLIREEIGELPQHVRILEPDTEISTLSLFSLTDIGVTVRGTCGMELPCFAVPTLTAGTGRYSGLGFTLDSATSEEYLSRLANLPDVESMTEQQVALAKRHALAAFVHRQWRIKSFQSVFGTDYSSRDPLGQNIEIRVSSANEMKSRGDMERWATWAGETDLVDYLELGSSLSRVGSRVAS